MGATHIRKQVVRDEAGKKKKDMSFNFVLTFNDSPEGSELHTSTSHCKTTSRDGMVNHLCQI